MPHQPQQALGTQPQGRDPIYRNIRRLVEAGIITAKVGHGKKADFELHVHEQFLIVSDRSRPGWNPLPEAKSPDAQSAFCKVIEKLIEQLKYTIYSAYAVDKVDFSATADGDGATHRDGKIGEESQGSGLNNRNTLPEQREWPGAIPTPSDAQADGEQNSGGRAAEQLETNRRLTEELRGLYGRAYTKKPTWQALQRSLFAQLFVDYAIEKLYTSRGVTIYPEARSVAIDYAER